MHIIKRGWVYYFRRRVPLDLVAAHNGQREVYHSLHTKDRSEANRLARRASVALDDRWDTLRGREPAFPPQALAVTRTIDQEPTGQQEHTVADKQSKTEGLAAMLPHWKRERRPNTKTADAYTRAVQEFDAMHHSPTLVAVTRHMVIEYRDKLQQAGKSVSTVNGRMAFIRALFGVAKGRGLITTNPAEDATLPADKRAVEARMPYSRTQADAIMSRTERHKDDDPARYWLPRLARWTGARLNELHQLRRQDLTERDGIRGVTITDEGEYSQGVPMKLKNGGSRRWVPLHPALCGFWTWATSRPAGPLFPATPNKFGIISDAYSKAYGRMLRDVAKISDPRITFHSWRHTFADMCRAAGVAPEVRMALMGHAESGAAGGYGSGQLPTKVLSVAINRLT